jgi:hypothetical protein
MAATAIYPPDTAPLAGARSYVSWPAVFAGNAVTGGLILVMLPLGAAGGLAMASAYRAESFSGTTIGVAAILWLAFMYLFSISAGGYVVGRLRPRAGDADLHEVRFRDAVNGFVFWGVGMIVSALFTFLTLSSAVGTATSAVGQAVGGAASGAVQNVNSGYIADLMLRSTSNPGSPAAPNSGADTREEIGRILAASAVSGQVPDADKQYLASLVAQKTGLSEADAKSRVDDGLKKAADLKDQAAAKTQAAAEEARKRASQAAFWTAILSLISGIAAMFAARVGGQHRDANRY